MIRLFLSSHSILGTVIGEYSVAHAEVSDKLPVYFVSLVQGADPSPFSAETVEL